MIKNFNLRLIKKNERVSANTSVAQFLEKEATINKDFSLIVIHTNVPSKHECSLRENLANKIQKGTFYASKNGSISFMNLGYDRRYRVH